MNYTNAFIASDLYSAGKNEDGQDIIGEEFYVMAENERGDRVRHFAGFKTITNVRWELVDDVGEMLAFDVAHDAADRANRLLERVLASGIKINAELWQEARPCYGSDAYVEYGQDNDVMWEKENG